jgi:very-short-patch-repair endonuclease
MIRFISLSAMQKRVVERHMFYGASKKIFLQALELRNNMTQAETILWEELRDREVFKAKWRSQHPVDILIIDFYCHKYRLAIEVDGEIHLNQEVLEHDDGREHDIEKLGIKILRFTNKEIFENIEFVKKRILNEINSLSPLQGI